jgi:hypothetical protein
VVEEVVQARVAVVGSAQVFTVQRRGVMSKQLDSMTVLPEHAIKTYSTGTIEYTRKIWCH